MADEPDAPDLSTRDGYPPGIPCWVDVTSPDPDASEVFYGGLFGWTFERRTPPQAPVQFSMGRLGGKDVAGVVTPEPGAAPVARWNTYVATSSVDASIEAVRRAGGRVTSGPSDVPEAGRSAQCVDDAGAEFFLWESHGRIGAQVVNAPGSWNWSILSTPDPTAAAAFYGSVFGWVALGGDPGGATLLAKPGYSDWLSERDPGLRERHAAAQVPAGFSDAAAWVQRADDPVSTWDVTFAVADTDAVAGRAAELGGTVLDAPRDLGPTRLAVLRDPLGAPFTVSHYRG